MKNQRSTRLRSKIERRREQRPLVNKTETIASVSDVKQRTWIAGALWLERNGAGPFAPAVGTLAVSAFLSEFGGESLETALDWHRRECTLAPGTHRYLLAEFFDTWYLMAQMARASSNNPRTPAYIGVWKFLELGIEVMPDTYDHARRELRRIVALVCKALSLGSTLGENRRERILGRYPLIAYWLRNHKRVKPQTVGL